MDVSGPVLTGDLTPLMSIFQVFGYPGLVMLGGWRIWVWWTGTKHVQDREDRLKQLEADTAYKSAWLQAQQEHTKELQGMRRDLNDIMLMLSYGQPEAVAALLKHRSGGN